MNARFFLFFAVSFYVSYSYTNANVSSDSTITVKASEKYRASRFRKFFFGSEYRKEWATPVTMKILDLSGASCEVYEASENKENWRRFQIDIQCNNGIPYILKAIDKTIVDYFPGTFQKNIASFIIRDQYSSAHPYAPLVVPDLAKSAGLSYIRPELVYVPIDSVLGPNMDMMSKKPAYLEGRTIENINLAPGIPIPDDIIETDSLISLMEETHNLEIDIRLYAKSRLFDMLIGDSRRNQMQWLWLLKSQNGKLYVSPLPINYEHAFFRFDGIVPFIINASGFGNFQVFSQKIRDVKGLNKSAAFMDRYILTSLAREDWESIAMELKEEISSDAISQACKSLPSEVYDFSAGTIIQKLISRRDMLPKAAIEYYEFLSRVVSYTGSKHKEKYFIERKPDMSTRLTVSRIFDGKEHVVFCRVFKYEETKEIRLYALSGEDEFYIYGKAERAIKLRVVGGKDRFHIENTSEIKKKRNVIIHAPYIENVRTEQKRRQKVIEMRDSLTAVERLDYQPNRIGINLLPEFNVDDGLFLGLGLTRKTFGFNKEPYATLQKFGGNFASATSAFNIKYAGNFINLFSDINLSVDASVIGPQYAFNYFGMGNETRIEAPINFYRIRAKEYLGSFSFYKNITPRFHIGIGPLYQYMKIERTEGRFLASSINEEEPELFESNHVVAGRTLFQYSSINDIVFPSRGLRLDGQIGYFRNLFGQEQFVNIRSFMAFYKSIRFRFPLVLAVRVGGATNFGTYKFFQANVLGGNLNFRGLRRTRFYGRSIFYQNTELRSLLISRPTVLVPFEGGVLAWFDHGRVWADGETSNLWHYAMGPGLWLSLNHRWVFTTTYGFAPEENVFNVRVGYLF